MDPAQRAQVEALLARRDAEAARAAGRIPEAFMDGNSCCSNLFFFCGSCNCKKWCRKKLNTSYLFTLKPIQMMAKA